MVPDSIALEEERQRPGEKSRRSSDVVDTDVH
jgi:hypothetical protein